MMTIHLLHEIYFTRIFWENIPPEKIFVLVPVHTVLQRRAVRGHLGPPPVTCLRCLYSSCLVPESAISPHWPWGITYPTGLWNKRGTFSQLDASKIFEIAAICYRKVLIPSWCNSSQITSAFSIGCWNHLWQVHKRTQNQKQPTVLLFNFPAIAVPLYN